HFGTLVDFCFAPDRAAARALAGPFIPRNRVDDATVETCTAFGPPALLRERLEEYAAAGGSKFIARPMCPPDRMLEQLHQLAEEVVPAFHRRCASRRDGCRDGSRRNRGDVRAVAGRRAVA